MNKYPSEYVAGCRKKVANDIAGFRKIESSNGSLASFETIYFNNMVIVLEALFMHRSRTLELKDGNPLNEVRMIAASLMNGDQLERNNTIKYKPEHSVLKYSIGDKIAVDAAGFRKLSDAFFEEIDEKFV